MAITNKQVTITTSPTPLNDADPDGANMTIKIEDAVYLGNENVSINNGFLLDSDEIFDIFIGPNEIFYAMIEDGTTTAYVLMTLC